MKKIFLFACTALLALSASAERADSLKRAVVSYGSLDVDEVSQTRILSGGVVLTRGTLVMKSDKAVVKETPEGYVVVTLNAGPGKMATFRQKRDGGNDLWVEGQAQKIEYDEKAELVKLFGAAEVRQLEGSKLMNQIESAFVSYDSRKEVMQARNDASGVDKPGQGRGTLIIAPRRETPLPASAPSKDKQ
jgi:lipopolysaccharide export system protein LptA